MKNIEIYDKASKEVLIVDKKEKIESKEMYINNLLALIHILDKFEVFKNRIKNYMRSKDNTNKVYNIFAASKGDITFSSKAK